MRLINADEVIRELNKRKAIFCREDADFFKLPLDERARVDEIEDCILTLCNTLSVNTEPHWIPVKEQLPKEDGSYLVSGKWGSGKESVGDCEFSVEDGYFQTAWNFDVLAWMPLPASYQPQKGENK